MMTALILAVVAALAAPAPGSHVVCTRVVFPSRTIWHESVRRCVVVTVQDPNVGPDPAPAREGVA